jgi:hypothetical protein
MASRPANLFSVLEGEAESVEHKLAVEGYQPARAYGTCPLWINWSRPIGKGSSCEDKGWLR